MQSTNSEFEILLKNVTHDLKRHTGHAEFLHQTSTIITYSQGQSLEATITQLDDVSGKKYAYYVTIDKKHNVGPVYQNELTQCHSHLYGLIISQLGDKVVNSLLK